MSNKSICSFPDCGRQCRGLMDYCQAHYRQLWRGEALRPLKVRPAPDREANFWAKVDKSGDCWIWQGSVGEGGYGKYTLDGNHVAPHRRAWELENKEPLGSRQADHLCHEPLCCNPAHIQPATQSENGQNRQGSRADSTHGFRNVFRNNGSYGVRLQIDGKRTYFGTYPTAAEAGEVARQMRVKHYPRSQW